MRTGIHPTYQITTVSCACGNSFVTRSIKSQIKLEICAACHPFFTGKQKFIDTEGRIERFSKKLEQAKVHQQKIAEEHKKKKAARKTALKAVKPQDKKAKVLSTRPRG